MFQKVQFACWSKLFPGCQYRPIHFLTHAFIVHPCHVKSAVVLRELSSNSVKIENIRQFFSICVILKHMVIVFSLFSTKKTENEQYAFPLMKTVSNLVKILKDIYTHEKKMVSRREFGYVSWGFNLCPCVSPVSVVKFFPIVTIVTSANYTPRAFVC